MQWVALAVVMSRDQVWQLDQCEWQSFDVFGNQDLYPNCIVNHQSFLHVPPFTLFLITISSGIMSSTNVTEVVVGRSST